jgi:hypothetical protein
MPPAIVAGGIFLRLLPVLKKAEPGCGVWGMDLGGFGCDHLPPKHPVRMILSP